MPDHQSNKTCPLVDFFLPKTDDLIFGLLNPE